MKKTILILFLFLTSFSVFSQGKNDSVKTKSVKYLIDFSLHNLDGFGSTLGPAGTGSRSWQSDLSFGVNYKRHTILTGISGGPSLSFSNHYASYDSIDYFSYSPDYNKWGIYGANLSYLFQFNSLSRKSKSSVEFYSSFSRYRDKYYGREKIIIQSLIGYSYSGKINNSFSYGFQILVGIFYNIDINLYFPQNRYNLEKIFPTIMFNPNISYRF